MTAFRAKNPASDELTQNEMNMLEQITKRLKKDAAVFYHEEPRCEATVRAMYNLNPKVIKWNGFMETDDDDLVRHTQLLWTSSFRKYKETDSSIGVNVDTYASNALAEIEKFLPHTGMEDVDTCFVIVKHPVYALAMALHIANQFNKRTWENDVKSYTHQDGVVIKLTATDMLVISPPRVN